MFFVEIIIGALIAAGILYFYSGGSEKTLRSFFAGTLTVAALIYVGFALYGSAVGSASTGWILVELIGLAIYFAFAYFGFKKSAMLLSLGWALHVVWDVALHSSTGVLFVPGFYPSMCLGFDLVFATYIFYRFQLSYRE